MDIWTIIEQLKTDKKWTDLDLAKRLGRKSHSYVSNLRQGMRPSPKIAKKIAELLAAESRIEVWQKDQVILHLLGIAEGAAA